MKKSIFILTTIITLMSSCKVVMESKFYADKSSSAEIEMRLEPSLVQKMNAMDSKSGEKKIHGKPITSLPTDWISFYDMVKDSIKVSGDTAEFMKKIYIKYDIENGQFYGFKMKADRLKEGEHERFNNQFNHLNFGKKADSLKPESAIEPKVEWDGKNLTLKLGNNDALNSNKDKKKSKSKEDADMFKKMFKDGNIVLSYRYSFEKKITKIQGKHDFLRKVDDHTVVFEIDFKKIMEMSSEGKSLKHQDSVIVIQTK